MVFAAGQYTVTYNAKACGQASDGIRISHQFLARLITGDAMGDTPQDSLYRGLEMLVAFNLMNYNAAAVQDILWPYGAAMDVNTVGLFAVQNGLAKQLVLTSVITSSTTLGGGTVGSTNAPVPATRTIPLAILQEGFPVELLFAPDLREVPVRMRGFPDASTGAFGTDT